MKSTLRPTLVRFLIVGGVSYLVNQALLAAFYDGALASVPRGAFNGPLLVASATALELSILVRFALNDIWTFRDRREKSFAARFYQSNFTSFGSPLIALAAVNILTPVLGINYLVSNSIGILLGLAWNWYCSVRIVWTSRRESKEVALLPPYRYEEVRAPYGRRLLRLRLNDDERVPSSFFLHAATPKLTAPAHPPSTLSLWSGRRDQGGVRRGA